MMRALPRTTGPDYGGSLCPPDELCDLVDAEFATTNHSPIEPLFAGPASRAAAAHASVIAEVQRRCAERGIATTVVGDAAMADHYPAGLLRPVAQSRVLVRPTDDGAMRALRRTMTHLGALNSGAEWSFPTGDGGGADAGDVRIATALDPGATFAAATRAVWAQTHTEPGSAGGDGAASHRRSCCFSPASCRPCSSEARRSAGTRTLTRSESVDRPGSRSST